MSKRCVQCFAAALLVFAASTPSVQAAAVSNIWDLFIGTETVASDDSVEVLINNNGGSPTVIDVGDYFVGKFNVFSILSPTSYAHNGSDGWENEFTGVFQLEVASKVATGKTRLIGGVQVPEYHFSFIPVASNPLGITGWDANTMVMMFSDPADDFKTTNAGVSDAIGGMMAYRFGFTAGATTVLDPNDPGGAVNMSISSAGEGWETFAPQDLTAFTSAIGGDQPGDYRLSLGLLERGPGVRNLSPVTVSYFDGLLAGTQTVPVNGFGDLFKTSPGQVNAGWMVADNLQLVFTPVPEPSMIAALAGMCLTGLGFIVRRRFGRV